MREGALLFIHALTPLHAGSGAALGHVDLPIQRERHTQWPIIPGSSLKGVLRQDLGQEGRRDDSGLSSDTVITLFGPERGQDARDHAGALSIGDARILAFPVRSLLGVFAWVTCPAALLRFRRDAGLAGLAPPPDDMDYAALKLGQALVAVDSPLLIEEGSLLLEDLEFNRKGDTGALLGWLAEQASADPQTVARLKRHLVVLADDDFSHFARHATEITARIGLDSSTKTVAKGALFYEEFLPAESLLYAMVLAVDSRRKDAADKAEGLLAAAAGALPELIQVGADETIGRGFCAPRLVRRGGGS